MKKTLKLLEWNINGRSAQNKKIPDFAVTEMLSHNADIIVLTEFVRGTMRKNLNKLNDVLGENNYNVFCLPDKTVEKISAESKLNNEVLIAVKDNENLISTAPYHDMQIFKEVHADDAPNFLQVEVNFHGMPITVIGTRIRVDKDNAESRKTQHAKTIEHIRKIENPVLLTGDFNCNKNLLESFYESYAVHTPEEGFSHRSYGSNLSKLDHIVVKGLEVTNPQYSWDYMKRDKIYDGDNYNPAPPYPDHAILTANIEIDVIEKQEKLNTAFNVIGSVLSEAAQEIANELESRDDFKQNYEVRFGNKKKFSKGLITARFDFRNYIWITVREKTNDKKQWLISLNFNDIDNNNEFELNSGNLHTQFGRIQFWKELNIKEKCCASPHELISKDGSDITLKFCGNKSFDPKQAIYDGTYEPVALVDKFLYEFLNCERKSNQKET